MAPVASATLVGTILRRQITSLSRAVVASPHSLTLHSTLRAAPLRRIVGSHYVSVIGTSPRGITRSTRAVGPRARAPVTYIRGTALAWWRGPRQCLRVRYPVTTAAGAALLPTAARAVTCPWLDACTGSLSTSSWPCRSACAGARWVSSCVSPTLWSTLTPLLLGFGLFSHAGASLAAAWLWPAVGGGSVLTLSLWPTASPTPWPR